MADQDAGWVDEDGLWWCVLGGAAAIQPEWFHTLLSVMSPRSPADRLLALLREGFTLQIDDVDAVVGIRAEHGSGLTVFGRGSVLRAALCYWENYDLQLASIPAEHAHKAAFDRAYDAVRAVGVEVLGEPSVQGRDRDEDAHRWSAWRIGEVVLAVYQAALDVMYGLSIQLDVRVTRPPLRWSPRLGSSTGCGLIHKRLYATKPGERPRSLAVRCVCHLMPQCKSSRRR